MAADLGCFSSTAADRQSNSRNVRGISRQLTQARFRGSGRGRIHSSDPRPLRRSSPDGWQRFLAAGGGQALGRLKLAVFVNLVISVRTTAVFWQARQFAIEMLRAGAFGAYCSTTLLEPAMVAGRDAKRLMRSARSSNHPENDALDITRTGRSKSRSKNAAATEIWPIAIPHDIAGRRRPTRQPSSPPSPMLLRRPGIAHTSPRSCICGWSLGAERRARKPGDACPSPRPVGVPLRPTRHVPTCSIPR